MRAIGLVLLSIAIMALLLTDADAKRRSSAQGSQAAGASRSWCATYSWKGINDNCSYCHATTVSGPGVGARWLLPTQSVSGHGVWDRLHLVTSDALERRLIAGGGPKGLLGKFKTEAPICLAQQRAVRLFPGVDAALDVAGRGEARVLRRLHRHRRALPERTVENDALTGGARELVQHAAGTHIGGEVGVGGVQRAGDDAVLLAFAAFAQIDEYHVRPALERAQPRRQLRPIPAAQSRPGRGPRACSRARPRPSSSGWED